MSKFNVGDKVFLSPESKWVDGSDCNPLNIVGVVDELEILELSRGRLGIGVMWSNGIHNSYRDYDLIPAEQSTQECPYCIIEELEAKTDNLEELVSDQAHQINQLTKALDNFTRLTHYFSTEGAGKLPNAKLGDSVVDAILDYFKTEYSCQYDQAQCYFRLNDLLQKHESFQESGKCRSDELADTIEVLQRSYDNYQSTEGKPAQFKPVREYTLEDWASATVSGWKFECRNGNIVTIEHLDSFSERPVLCSNRYYHNINGMWDEIEGEDADDIIRRVS